MNTNEFALNLLAGRTVECAVKDALRTRYGVIATGSIATGNRNGPRMENNGAGVVLADLQLQRGARAGWVEIKAKSASNHYYTWQRDEHGIDAAKHADYCRLQAESERPVYLLICEFSTGDLLMQSLPTLRSTGRPRVGNLYNRQMINWDRSAFVRIGSLAIPGEDLRRLSITIDWPIFETFITQPMLIETGAL